MNKIPENHYIYKEVNRIGRYPYSGDNFDIPSIAPVEIQGENAVKIVMVGEKRVPHGAIFLVFAEVNYASYYRYSTGEIVCDIDETQYLAICDECVILIDSCNFLS